MNRASKWADLDSYIPYTGRVDLKIETDLKEVAVRAPSWIAANDSQLTATVNGQPTKLAWDGRYVKLGPVKAKDVVSITFPIQTETITRLVYGQPLETVLGGVVYQQLMFKGNELISISPEGKIYPYYQRQKYLGPPQMITVERFVSAENIDW